jgi:tetratricopeptide (TPR) repeat protein
MPGYANWFSSRFSRVLTTGAAVLVCAFYLTACADERPAKPDSANVAKTSPSRSAGSPDAEGNKTSTARIEQLIRDLGSPNYTTRRSAATELRQIGTDAFDLLYAATDDVDPEIASSANYLLRQAPIRWVQADDPPRVRETMRSYGQEPEARRLRRIEELDRVPNDKGIAALCRIARFDRSSLVSRSAALAIIRPSEKPTDQAHMDQDAVKRELGGSTRASAMWIREYLTQLRDPASSVGAWKSLISAESDRLEKNMGDTSSDIVLGLSWNLADLYRQIGDQKSLNATLDQMIGLAAEGSDDMLVSLLAWLTENKSWEALDGFISKHQARLEQGKKPMYYAALARAKQGKKDQAEELAAKAVQIASPEGGLDSLFMARDLEERSQFDWSVREYRHIIEKQSADQLESILSRSWLASMQHDYEHEKDAADTLEPLVKAVGTEGRSAVLYAKTYELYHDKIDVPEPKELKARYHYYLSCYYQSQKDMTRAQTELNTAIESDPKDADVLIAMYRFPTKDLKWHENALTRIQKLCSDLEKQIQDEPSEASPYNQWAWLVSNTEGDFQKAIRYSHRSLELNKHGEGGAASFLDTLGRCYFAAGDYDNAVKYEREAIAKNDYLQVMKRQLAEFEQALAKQKSGAAEKPAKKAS